MNAMQIFDYSGHTVRVIEAAGVPYFVGSDIAEVPGCCNNRDALRKYVDEEDKGIASCDTPGGVQEVAA